MEARWGREAAEVKAALLSSFFKKRMLVRS